MKDLIKQKSIIFMRDIKNQISFKTKNLDYLKYEKYLINGLFDIKSKNDE